MEDRASQQLKSDELDYLRTLIIIKMHYVYLLQSTAHPNQRYTGITSDLKDRLKAHNEGRSPHTSKYKPWMLVTYLAFSDKSKAANFEQYLKSGSGHAFANKRLW
jgi:predicted GIY-YIG superfamily endonuclease